MLTLGPSHGCVDGVLFNGECKLSSVFAYMDKLVQCAVSY